MKLLLQVLLVDDNPADVGLTREALAGGRHQAAISEVYDGEAALAYFRRSGLYAHAVRPDLIILDLNLPKKSGRSVLTEIKADADLKQIPVVVFSTSKADSDVNGCYALGANCYMNKPGNLNGYFSAVHAIQEFWLGSATLPQEDD